MAQWEYRILAFPSGWLRGVHSGTEPRYVTRAEEVLDALGRQEWEAVSLEIGDAGNATVLLKRQLVEEVAGALEAAAEEPEVVVAADAMTAVKEAERVLKESG